jgi:hypothetical protein
MKLGDFNKAQGPWREGSFVYFVQAGDGGPIKIGTSKRPNARLASLRTSHAAELRVLAIVPGTARFEAWIHRLFASDRQRGEWFAPSERLCIFIAGLLMQQGRDLVLRARAVRRDVEEQAWFDEIVRQVDAEMDAQGEEGEQ